MKATFIKSVSDFYVVGGTMRHDAPSYVERMADKQLFSALMRNEFCHVLTARQMGKSSLMLRTAARLRDSGVGVAVLDLTAIGQNLTTEQWYSGLVIQMGDRLDMEDELLEFWAANTLIGPMQRWVSAIRKVVLPQYPGRLVIFIDEIDAIRSLNFSTDEFFAGIRECYNLRNEDREIQRLTFCLLGVATPSDLIRDTRTTPFNVGQRIELNDFTNEESLFLADGLRRSTGQNRTILKRILYWTGGHPYLTQRICQAVVENEATRDAHDVDQMIEELFFSKRAQEYDDNLIFVRERLLRSDADLPALLNLYSKIWRRKSVPDDDSNTLVTILRLSGITRIEKGLLRVRNRIYERVFNKTWVTSSLPDFEVRRQREAYRRGVLRTATVSTIILLVVVGLALMALWQRNRAVEQASVNHRLLYMAQMKLAYQEWENANISRVKELLEATRPLTDEEDMRGFEWYLLQGYAHKEIFRLEEPHLIANVKFLSDKNVLAVGAASHTLPQREYSINLYNWNTKEYISSFKVQAGNNFDVIVFSPDLKYVATDSPDNTVALWDINSGQNVRLFKPSHEHGIRTIAFAPGKQYMASADLAGNLKIWDIATGEEKLALSMGGTIHGLAFSPDGRLLSITSETNSARILDILTGKVIKTFTVEDGSLSQAIFSPDGKQLATATTDGHLYFWDISAGRTIPPVLSHSSEILSFAFSPDGKTLATGSLDRTVKLWNLKTGKELQTIRGHGSRINFVDWSPDGKFLVTGAGDRTVKIWDAFAKVMPTMPAQKVRYYLATAFTSTDELLGLAAADDSPWKLWNLSTGQKLLDLDEKEDSVLCAAFSKDANMIATGGSESFVKIREIGTGRIISTLTDLKSTVYALDFSPDGKTIISGDKQGNLILWDVSSGYALASLNSGNSYYRVVFSPDGKWLASADKDGTIRLWDVVSRKIAKTFISHTSVVRIIAFSPDSRLMATGSDDNTVALWDIDAGKELKQLVQSDSIMRLAFTQDSKRLVSGGLDGSLTLWDVTDMQEVMTLKGHRSEITSITFSKNGKTLAASSRDGMVNVWQAADSGE
jgi:WD40 repeat protein